MCWELKHLFNGNDQIETSKKKKNRGKTWQDDIESFKLFSV